MSTLPLDAERRPWATENLPVDVSEWTDTDTEQLLELARRNVVLGIRRRPPFQPAIELYSRSLKRLQSTFVTLRDRDRVLGRAGTVRPAVPLARDVCHNAYAVSRHAVGIDQEAELTIDVQVVSPLRHLSTRSREDVLSNIRRGKDGVFLQHGNFHATFTPDKWQEWPDGIEFLQALHRKAGLDAEVWNPRVRIATYQVAQLPRIKVDLAHELLARKAK